MVPWVAFAAFNAISFRKKADAFVQVFKGQVARFVSGGLYSIARIAFTTAASLTLGLGLARGTEHRALASLAGLQLLGGKSTIG